jgi:hypothetical protein
MDCIRRTGGIEGLFRGWSQQLWKVGALGAVGGVGALTYGLITHRAASKRLAGLDFPVMLEEWEAEYRAKARKAKL